VGSSPNQRILYVERRTARADGEGDREGNGHDNGVNLKHVGYVRVVQFERRSLCATMRHGAAFGSKCCVGERDFSSGRVVAGAVAMRSTGYLLCKLAGLFGLFHRKTQRERVNK
jgi:hypothetical protein